MSFYRERLTEASKPHICSECHGLIEAKEHYWNIAGTCCEDGDFYALKMCGDCMAEHIRIREPGEPMYFTQLHEYQYHNDPDPGVAQWFEMRQRRQARAKEWLATKKAATGSTPRSEP